MLNAQQLALIKLEDLSNPLTWRFNLSTPFGITSQELTLDVPAIGDDLAAALMLGARVWTDHIASAITASCSLDFIELVRWKISPLPVLGAAPARPFASHLPATGKFNSGLLVLHTGHKDSRARRRFFLPCMPRNWQTDNVLNDAGRKNLGDLSRILIMGLQVDVGGSPMRWLLPYPDSLEADIGNLRGVGFRDVRAVRVCDHCDKAPDTVPIDWP